MACLDVLLLGLRAETARVTLVSDRRDGKHVEQAWLVSGAGRT